MPHRLIRVTDTGKIVCPICGCKGGCANVAGSEYWFCMRVQQGCVTDGQGNPMKLDKNMGWMHKASGPAKKAKGRVSLPAEKKLTHLEIKAIMKEHRDALTKEKLDAFSKATGLEGKYCEMYGIGYDPRSGCYSFPMVDEKLRYNGIRLRSLHGDRKRCVLGSSNGIFVPKNLDLRAIPPSISDDPYPLVLLTPEGPTTSIACAQMGFQAIGRPSNMGGIEIIRELLIKNPKQDVVIVADNDTTKWLKDKDKNPTEPFWPGWEGALALADAILPVVGRLRVIKPRKKENKDLRNWLNAGGTHGLLLEIIGKSQFINREWIQEKSEEVRVWKKNLKRPLALAA